MNIVIAMLLSVGVKAISAIVEICIQILMTRNIGVTGYGEYTFFVSLIETAYFILFSGSIKLNTFYLASNDLSLKQFSQNYRKKYVFPIILSFLLLSILLKNPCFFIATIILLLYYFALNKSSIFLAKGHQGIALVGEYLVGRIAMLTVLLILVNIGQTDIYLLCILYGIQFLTIIAWLLKFDKKIHDGTKYANVSMKKLVEFQKSDIANAFISYAPAILQYIFGSAFSAGFTGVLSILKKIINFIAGPTAKVFLPECSRLYKQNAIDKLKQTYLMIVKVQMLVIGSAAMLLIGFPKLVLDIFSKQLNQYNDLLVLASLSLLMVASIGPVTGFLQMTGNEVICNRNQWISIGIMFLVCFMMKHNEFFAVYGLCAQAVTEGILKYYSICRWFKCNVVPLKQYLLFLVPIIVGLIIVDIKQLNQSVIALGITLMFVSCWNLYFIMKDPLVRATIKRWHK